MSEAEDTVRVLHVDDEPDFADMVGTYLERENERYDVETATSASRGIERVSEGTFDCIVSDYDMPDRNGIELLKRIREFDPDIPFILFTGKGSEEVASEAISAGVTDYMQKGTGTDQYTVLANRIANSVEQHRAEQEVERTRRRLTEISESTPDCLWMFDRDWEELLFVSGYEAVWGRSEAELRENPQDFLEGVHPDDREFVRDVMDRLSNGESVDVEYRIVRNDGEEGAVWVKGEPVFDDGEVVRVVGFTRDVTEHGDRRERLRESTARLEALFQESPDMINVHDTEGNIVDPNPRLREKTGYDASELTEMKVWELDEAITPEEARSLWEGMDVGDSWRSEGRYRRRDGSTFPVEVHIRRLRLDGEDRFIVIARDVSEQTERERELRRYERIVEDLDDVATIIDREGTITYVSPSVRRMLGYEPEELVGENGFGYQPPETTEAVAEAIEQVIENPDEPRTVQTQFRRADGSWCWIESTLRNRLDDDMIEGILVSSREISERVERRRELQRQNERLDEFASIVSHDLRSPLNVSEGRLELARMDCESEHLAEVARAHDRMGTLLDDLLTLAREGESVTEPEPVDLAAVVEECWTTTETADATLVTESSRVVGADESRLKQALENLVRNAVEHGDEDVTVTVGVLEDGFYVADDGPGIPEDERGEVFEAGYSTSEGRTGFGLGIVKQVVEAHGWEIRVTDGTAGGARFEITGVEGHEDG